MPAGGARPGAGRPAYNSNNYINASFRRALHEACTNAGGERGLVGFFEQSLRERPECVFPLIIKCLNNDPVASEELLKKAGSLRVNFYIDYLKNGTNGHSPAGPTISTEILPSLGHDTESESD